MRNKEVVSSEGVSSEGDRPEKLPAIFEYIATNQVPGFDSIRKSDELRSPSLGGLPSPGTVGIPSSPRVAESRNAKRVLFTDNNDYSISIPQSTTPRLNSPSSTSYSQSMLASNAVSPKSNVSPSLPPRSQKSQKLNDKRIESFKTWSGKLERQLTMRGKRQTTSDEADSHPKPDKESLPARRYFAALKGPELDTLRASEEILLPDDKLWPFLLRFPISSFGMCLGVGSQTIMWKALATTASVKFLHISLNVNLFLWCISIVLLATISVLYTLKVIFYFEAVRREYYHPIRINFFFAPWIAFLFIAIGLPPSIANRIHVWLWYPLMAPIFFLELKIYGQWMSGGQRRLSKVANPSNHLSIVGNFVGALLGASLGLKEGPLFFFAVGLAHYMVLFVTLYQRLPTNETLPKELHPVFFLFVSGPSVASMAWANIQGSFDYGARICYFISLFLYFSLAVRVNFFRGFRFSIAWWAYTFPMTGAAIATIRYSNVVTNIVTKFLAVALSFIATLTVATLLVTTIIYAFVLQKLFPNDMAIAIKDGDPKGSRRFDHSKYRKFDKEEDYFKCFDSDKKNTEVGDITPPSSNKQGHVSSALGNVLMNYNGSVPS